MATSNIKIETGRCNYMDEQGNLCLAISYIDENGIVTTEPEIVVPVTINESVE